MTQEDKQLLLSDLCGRLPYGVKVKVTDVEGFTFEGELRVISKGWCKLNISDPKKKARVKNEIIPLNHIYIKSYLRPMSSMTEEEKEEIENLAGTIICYNEFEGNSTLFDDAGLDWLNKKMFDYRGLIQKGLALEASEGMYKS